MTRSTPRTVLKRGLLAAFGAVHRRPGRAGILLTFDDGPHPDVTPAVLEQLSRYQAKAVFFIVGHRISRAPHVLRRILAEGHLIGNHTYRHPLDRTPPLMAYYRDVQQCQTVLESETGRRPSLFRPPLGSVTVGGLIAPRLAGLRTMLWSVDVDDWKLRSESDAVLAGKRLGEVAGPGDIVLLHDDNPWVITVLETALPRLRERQVGLCGTTECLVSTS